MCIRDRVEENPYMAKSDANIHHDGYNTDSTDEILPVGIYPEDVYKRQAARTGSTPPQRSTVPSRSRCGTRVRCV